MSPGPHSANERPGTAAIWCASGRQYLSSILRPSINSPFGFKGQGSAICKYSVGSTPQISAGSFWPPPPLKPSGMPCSRPMVWNTYLEAATNIATASALRVWVWRIPWAPVDNTCLICQALYWTSSGVIQFEGTVVITVGVICPLGVGPPSRRPFINWARPTVSNGWCSKSNWIRSAQVWDISTPQS